MECQASWLSIFVSHQWLGTSHPDKTGRVDGLGHQSEVKKFQLIKLTRNQIRYPFFSASGTSATVCEFWVE